jgi:hypothetical protein
LVYSYCQASGRDDVLPERTMMLLQQLELFCFCCHEGGRDPVAPSENQGPGGTHLRQPCGKVERKETLDGKEDDAAERGMCLGFVTLVKGALFICTY